MEQFVDKQLITDIDNNVIQVEFPKLNKSEQIFMLKYLVLLINYIALKFNFENKESCVNQLKQNNYNDVKGLLLMLLPFINETRKSKKEIKNLNDLYVQKQINSKDYEYSNIQYGRCKSKTNYNDEYQEIQFERRFFKHNFYLLKQTIQKISNKLYVNWINIRPIPISDDYDNLPLYIYTQEALLNRNFVVEDIKDPDFNYKGLSVQDIYEVITHKLYYDIRDIKWLIYDTKVQNGTSNMYYMLLNRMLPLDTILQNKKYNQLDSEEKKSFDIRLRAIKEKTKDPLKMDLNELLVAKILTANFDRINKNGSLVYKRLKIKGIDEDDEDEKLSRTYKYDIIIFKTFETIKSIDIYNFVYDQIHLFEKTWYGKSVKASYNANVAEDDKVQKTYLSHNINFGHGYISGSTVFLTLKNVYNYAKLMCSYSEDKKLVFLPKYWNMLDKDNQDRVVDRLNSKHNWFNINQNIKQMYNINDKVKITAINNYIYNMIKGIIITVIIDILVSEGILSTIVFQKELSDDTLLSKDELVKAEEIRNKLGKLVINPEIKKWEKCNYFITGTLYKDHIIKYNKYEKGNDNYAEMNYLQALTSDFGNMGSWYSTYAMNWVSQIGFFHKYMNNRIIYVTGSTGVGKSTQIPKLLLYALLMIDYKKNGNIICSQPRIAPTTDNADTISKQLGVPIKEYNDTYKKYIVSDNYQIQFKHQHGSHMNKQQGLILNIVTDGTLYEKIKAYPILKDNKDGIYDNMTNIHDIVIVDEAHEHNTNMDLILTLMKYAVYYNNDCRLVIISATMDDDEPTYRRYYRDVNDNRLFPLNVNLEKYSLDRINVDRRLHISPPNTTTRFTIDEIYEPNKTPEEIVMHILNTSTEGDILLFKPGEKEIKDSRDLLNKIMPPNCIALPFYSKLDPSKADLIKKLNDEKKHKLMIPRDIPYEKYNVNMGIVPSGTYNRVVIIATNIAEASITISTLKYVVDTGTEKVDIYDYKLNQSILTESLISESSRLQRKGRVGRVAPGTVYYNYLEGAMVNNKKKYGISVKDISETIFDLLANKRDILFSESPNDPNINFDITKMNYGLENLILEQYSILGKYFTYFGKSSHYQYLNHSTPAIHYGNGFDKSTLEDNKGSFYIVHPNEIDFDRDIGGNISLGRNDNIEYDSSTKRIVSYKIQQSWKYMQDKLFIFPKDKDDMFKTAFGVYVQSVKSNFNDYSLNEILTLIYGKKYNILDEIIVIMAMIKATNYEINNLALSNMFTKFQKLYATRYGDAYHIYNIGKKVLDFATTFNIIDIKNYRKEILLSKANYLESKTIIDSNMFEKLKKLSYQNALENTNMLSDAEFEKFMIDDTGIVLNIAKHENEIKLWCKNMLLNYDIIKKFIDLYFKISVKIEQYLNYNENMYKKLYIEPATTLYDKINYVFISGFATNILRRISIDNYSPMLNPSLQLQYGLRKIKIQNIVQTNAIYDNKYDNYILYLKLDVPKQKFGIVIPITNLGVLHRIHPFIYTLNNYHPDTTVLNKNLAATINSIKYDLTSIYKPENYIHYLNFEDSASFKEFVKKN